MSVVHDFYDRDATKISEKSLTVNNNNTCFPWLEFLCFIIQGSSAWEKINPIWKFYVFSDNQLRYLRNSPRGLTKIPFLFSFFFSKERPGLVCSFAIFSVSIFPRSVKIWYFGMKIRNMFLWGNIHEFHNVWSGYNCKENPIQFRLLVFGILVTLVAWFSFRFFPSFPSCLAKCKQRLRNIFVFFQLCLQKWPKTKNERWDEMNKTLQSFCVTIWKLTL